MIIVSLFYVVSTRNNNCSDCTPCVIIITIQNPLYNLEGVIKTLRMKIAKQCKWWKYEKLACYPGENKSSLASI